MDWDSISDKFGGIGEKAGTALKRVFGSRNERVVKTLAPIIKQVNDLEQWTEGLSAEQCREQVAELKAAVASGEKTLDDCLP